MKILTAPSSRRRSTLAAAALAASLALAACGSAEENPLGVNAAGRAESAEDTGTASGGRAVPVGADLGEDPLNIGVDGAELCGVQPDDSRLRYTVMLHNPTLETFTFGEMSLGNPEGLDILSSMVQTANREGHHHPDPEGGAHGEHTATPAPTSSPEPIGPPVPAEGYQFEPDAHVNIIVTVELADGATHGSADNILVAFSTPERDYSVAHNLKIDVDAVSCSG
ncbi:hypothetical protein MN0502_06230 [Arthrobacter sp. MN05-02]|nr:hypothetical protein MN0502_06230 [Arthrobacter sp. MN05-02]